MAKERKLRTVGSNETAPVESAVPEYLTSFEDEFETLLDSESDEDFGGGYVASDSNRGNLKQWTSQDFSNFYVRFRPHLERYAKRWLHNPNQIDEVVQDAFLYLMVTLPELDSEVGVLRFLKWKLRLICLDVLRASGKAIVNDIDTYSESLAADLPEHSSGLEAADDAAVVRLALSKLTPRHREVLLATMYEEKSIAEVAAQVSLSENATRQLLFRARAAFKVALIGDVDTAGMSAGAILSVAARKAAAEAKKVSIQAMSVLLLFALALGSYFSFQGRTPAATSVAQDQNNNKPATDSTGSTSTDSPASTDVASKPEVKVEPVSTTETIEPQAPSAAPLPTGALAALANTAPTDVTVYKASTQSGVASQTVYAVESEDGNLSATFVYGVANGVENLKFQILADGYVYYAYAIHPEITVVGDSVVVTGYLSDLINPNNAVIGKNPLTGARIRLEFNRGISGDAVQGAVLSFSQPNG